MSRERYPAANFVYPVTGPLMNVTICSHLFSFPSVIFFLRTHPFMCAHNVHVQPLLVWETLRAFCAFKFPLVTSRPALWITKIGNYFARMIDAVVVLKSGEISKCDVVSAAK